MDGLRRANPVDVESLTSSHSPGPAATLKKILRHPPGEPTEMEAPVD